MSDVAIIAIDGPSGVGKGTLAQYLCCKTGFHLLDSGAIYRSLAFATIEEEVDIEDISAVSQLAETLDVSFVDGSIFYKTIDITTKIRTEQIAAVASKVAAISEVRSALLLRQKNFAQAPGLIADGRDMGTVVFKQADLKLFLTASAQVRAERRVNQLKSQGVSANIAQITRDIEERDERDRTRASSPLVPAEDAIVLDTSKMTIEEVCQFAMSELWKLGIMK